MATRAESLHAQDQRHGLTSRARKRAKAKRTRTEKLAAPHPTKHAANKASYSREEPSARGRSSRKSTRSSANRAKPDTNLNLREELQKGSPESRFLKDRVRGARVRGSSRGPRGR